MTTAELQAASLAYAVAITRRELNLPPSGPLDITQRGPYLRALSARILAEPGVYSAQTLDSAQRYIVTGDQKPFEGLSAGEAVSIFTGELVNQVTDAGEAVAGVGQGVLTTAKIARYFIPVGLAVIVGAWVLRKAGIIK
ncbi:hypothetical protein [Synoicihabitans lomoniglobus]|uniref:Uncharacterized protein n=1 Tax=Synoicihabitans lomoniglobus TaxID=2909285 RepID=A0AAF0CRP7_9BACT|nr:hypothetical protein [Opitutaceae bacterium LMO-M01]WED66845.1 hypothetical protein PXH66_08280 [Opitutaceae bacterium LMO-M01]